MSRLCPWLPTALFVALCLTGQATAVPEATSAKVAAAIQEPGGHAADEGEKPDIKSADALFKSGHFAEAGKLYARVAAREPTQYQATVRLGYLALLSNRQGEAQTWLEKAAHLRPREAEPKQLLAEVHYRRDEFGKAAPLVRAVGKEAKAKKLESFAGQMPYALRGRGESVTLKLVRTDPLPLVRVRVNGREATFFIDTGAAEVILDTEFAREMGVKQFGSEIGTFAGGKQASGQQGRIDSLTLGDWTLENVPIGIINTRVFSNDLGAKQVDGCIGTVLFYHFLTTLDYPRGELILRRKTPGNLKPFEAAHAGRVVVPFWMADDHFMVARGRIDQREPMLFFLDSGLVPYDVSLARSVIDEAGIKLQTDKTSEGIGAGGKITMIPFELKQLSLGEILKKDAQGIYDGAFAWEHAFGFRLAGMIGHGFYRPYVLTFDFVHMRLFIEKSAEAIEPQVRFIQVEPDVKLEVLDWGGSGPPLVLLTGIGNTAHVYAHFAHQFTDKFHVVGITRRGFGLSSKPSHGYDVATRARDDVRVLDALQIAKASIAGHSIAGDELSKLAADYPDRVAKLVYLDSVDYGGFATLLRKAPMPPMPELTAAEKENWARASAASVRYGGVRYPDEEIHQHIKTDAAGRVLDTPEPDAMQAIYDRSQQAEYEHIKAPVLAIWDAVTPTSRMAYYWYLDQPQRDQYDRFWAQYLVWLKDARQRFRTGIKHARVIELENSHHYIFIRDEPTVAREMRKFLLDK
jgi:pimeloyl-ACP methyl ester carboxylesterase/predicted aspartyl protease